MDLSLLAPESPLTINFIAPRTLLKHATDATKSTAGLNKSSSALGKSVAGLAKSAAGLGKSAAGLVSRLSRVYTLPQNIMCPGDLQMATTDLLADIPAINLEYAFSITMNFAERIDFVGPRGGKGYVPPATGVIHGPMLSGKVVPYSGADYAIFKDVSEGIKVNTHYMLQTDDEQWIYINNRGYLHRSPDPENPSQSKLYFRFTPFFEAPFGKYEWMSRTMIVGTGQRLTNPDRSEFTYYVVK